MTKEEAIKIINCYDIGFYDLSGEKIPADKLAEAFDMAIEALQRTSNAHPTHECVKPTHECDIINRDKALNLVLDVCYDVLDECETVTGICGEEVYTDVREVDAILKCNKRIRNGIRQLPSEPLENSKQLEWIPCSGHPPEIDEEVFVYLFGDSPYVAWFDGDDWQTNDFTVDDDERPIAWMRLPKPWKGETDD